MLTGVVATLVATIIKPQVLVKFEAATEVLCKAREATAASLVQE